MADTGWLNPGSIDAGIGAIAWNDISNALESNDTYAYADNSGGISPEYPGYLIGQSYPTGLVEGQTVTGYEIRIERNGQAADYDVGLSGGDNLSADAAWTGGDDWEYFGGPTDLCGLDNSYETANAIELYLQPVVDAFGRAYVDAMQVKVHYTEAGPPPAGNEGAFFELF